VVLSYNLAHTENMRTFGLKTCKGQLGRPTFKWEDNIKMYLRETGLENLNHLGQDRNRWRALEEHDNETSGSIRAIVCFTS
jgi:hypothetical protein